MIRQVVRSIERRVPSRHSPGSPAHRPSMKTSVSLLLLVLLSAMCKTASVSETTSETSHVISGVLQCPTEDICTMASKCCMSAVDSYGWIAAAVGWSLWFLTLILYCVGKVMSLRPDEPKYMQA